MRIKVSFEGIKPLPGDVVVLRPQDKTTRYRAKEIYEVAQKAFPDNPVVILPTDVYLQKYNKEEFLKFLEHLKGLAERKDDE